MKGLHIIPAQLLSTYKTALPTGLPGNLHHLNDVELSTLQFSFYTSVASVFSSKIEGEDIELDSYIKHKRDGLPFNPDYTKKIDDLYNAYQFAQNNPLTAANLAEAHKLLSMHLVTKSYQGNFRTQNMYVATDEGRIDYVASSPHEVKPEMEKLYADLATLLKQELSFEETLYYAAAIHLVFVKIHPWLDGNGRCARLLEKWFLAQKLGTNAWFLQSEKMYYQHHAQYYKNIRLLGVEYELLDYSQSLPFLLMLPITLIG